MARGAGGIGTCWVFSTHPVRGHQINGHEFNDLDKEGIMDGVRVSRRNEGDGECYRPFLRSSEE